MIKVIKTEKEYKDALLQIETLIDKDPKSGTPEGDQLELLSFLISKYEEEKFELDLPDPIEAIKFRMEQQGLTRKDLVPSFGSASKLSEVFSGKRSLSLKMIRSLNKNFNIPFEILLKDSNDLLPEDLISMDWTKFPFNEMYKRDWFNNFSGTLYDAKDKSEELLRDFIEPVKDNIEQPVLLRTNTRLSSNVNEYSLFAWIVQVLRIAQKFHFSSKFDSTDINREFLVDIIKLSYLDEGPKLAVEYLIKKGICFVYLRHLPQTHLDGASLRLKNGHPVIALTLRHDRLDNFWFTLCHELAHIILHFDEKKDFYFIDDFDVEGNKVEKEADKMAQNALIPNEYWKFFRRATKISKREILNISQKLRIHHSLIAGRIRREKNNYKVFSNLVGSGQVRKLFCQ